MDVEALVLYMKKLRLNEESSSTPWSWVLAERRFEPFVV